MKKKVFIVEDDRIVAYGFQRIIQGLGHEVAAVAYTAKEALNTIDNISPNIVLMDITMETRTAGIDACNLIKNKYHLPRNLPLALACSLNDFEK